MAVISVTKGTQTTIVGNEHSLTQQANVGIYVLVLDLYAMQIGDTVISRIYTKHAIGGVSHVFQKITYSDVQETPNKYSIPVPIDAEIICTVEQTTGLGIDIPWNLLRV